jgi:hypothetical protein
MKQAMMGYHKDKEDDWVAELQCGHFQHVRHTPPFFNRPWITTQSGRNSMLGFELKCKKCDLGQPKDSL